MERIMALTKIEKKYLHLAAEKIFRKNNDITEEDFKSLAEEIGKSLTIVRNYVNTLVIKHETPVQPDSNINMTDMQKNLRLVMTGTSVGGREGFTVMSDASSSMIEGMDKGSSTPHKHDGCIYKGNPKVKR